MLPVQRIAWTAGFTCQLFVFRRAVGVRKVPSAFKIHGSATGATLAQETVSDSGNTVSGGGGVLNIGGIGGTGNSGVVGGGISGLEVEQMKLLLSIVCSISTLLLVHRRHQRHHCHRSRQC